MVIWITGLAGSGKTTIGRQVYSKIKEYHINTVYLDGDVFREVIGSYGYSLENRLIVAKKISNLCKQLENQQINVVCSTISLFNEIHKMNRENFSEYYEIFIEVTFDELLKRDQKGLYTQALKGEIKNVIGVDLSYDIPKQPNLIIKNNEKVHLQGNINKILDLIDFDGK
ncbi:adenylyl-sulfate kinase [Serpentinicella sp. ANB-PHB4]|uniref:adenylyl-sulfate kinase n=1 Tax=Serpentinicella sp. ANB-PHB4 TaxID=3074076 RepID=UPI00285BAEB4|nr:adenylyl-sulfate kinase [Serpentinicella sp. ANB-PHB4]MDR5659787.1 adenylyl-sulfate kinase [Serpentinicella sp. ANB-PHB4]